MSKTNNQKIIKDMERQKEYTSNSDNTYNNNKVIRSVLQIIKSETTQDGEGVKLNRSFPNRYISEFDPFLLLDEIGPIDIKLGKQKGFPNHPHRGFETVTYLLEGKFEHKDSQGHVGTISARCTMDDCWFWSYSFRDA